MIHFSDWSRALRSRAPYDVKIAKDQKIGVMWKLLFGTVTCLSLALPALSDSSKVTKTSCPGKFSKQSTLPTSFNCKMVRLPDGTMLQTVPKLFSTPAVFAGKIPGQHIICRIPDCGKNLCKNGWCEETMVGYNCTCSSGFQGRHCDEQSTEEATTKPTTSPSTTMTERSKTSQSTTTSEWVQTEAKTKSATSPTATIPELSNATTSQETPTSKSVESSTTDATTKPTMSPRTTVSDTTTSQDTTTSKLTELSTTDSKTKPTTSPTTTMSDTTTSQDTTITTCSSPPVECEYGGSFYNFSTCEMNHASAVSACSQYGSHLVFIESQEEEDFIVEHSQYNFYWIGLTGLRPSEARWLDGSSLTYSNFNSGSFDDNVNCFLIKCQGQCGWHDHYCSIQLRFICEKEVGI